MRTNEIVWHLINHGNTTETEVVLDFNTTVKVDGYEIAQVTYFKDTSLLSVYGLNESNEGEYFVFDKLDEKTQRLLSRDISLALYNAIKQKLEYIVNNVIPSSDPEYKLDVIYDGVMMRPISKNTIGLTVLEYVVPFAKINKLLFYTGVDDEGIYLRLF